MHYKIMQTDCTFFHKNKHLLFKEFYSEDELKLLNESEQIFDVAKNNAFFRKLLQQRLFGQLTSQLTKTNNVRFLFDMLIDASISHTNIEQLAPFSQVTMGILIPLKINSEEEDAVSYLKKNLETSFLLTPYTIFLQKILPTNTYTD